MKKLINYAILFIRILIICFINIQYLWIFIFIILIIFIYKRIEYLSIFKFFIIQETTTCIIILSLINTNLIIFYFAIFFKIGLVPFEKWFINLTKNFSWSIIICFLGPFKLIPIFIIIIIITKNIIFLLILITIYSIYKVTNRTKELYIIFYRSNFSNILILLINLFNNFFPMLWFIIYCIILLIINSNTFMKRISFFIILISLPPTFLFFLKFISIQYFRITNVYIIFIVIPISWRFIQYIYIIFKYITKIKINNFNINLFILYFFCCFLIL